MKLLKKLLTRFIFNSRMGKWSYLIIFINIILYLLYIIFELNDIQLSANLFMSLGAGMTTGLIIYALTNCSSRREIDLENVIATSQNAINGYQLLSSSLCNLSIISLSENERVHYANLCINGASDFINNTLKLINRYKKLICEKSNLEELYTDSFHEEIGRMINEITHVENQEDAIRLMLNLETKTHDIRMSLINMHNIFDEELDRLRYRII